MPSLGLLEAGGYPRPRLGFVALELLAQRPLAGTDALADLMKGAAPLGRVDLNVGTPLFEERRAEPLQLLAKLRQSQALILARCVEALGIGGQACLVLGDGLALLLAQLDELALELALAPVEVGGPGHQPLLEPLLD